jgi:Uncharacterized protein conserved in bacteria
MNDRLRKQLIGLAVILFAAFLLSFLIPHSQTSVKTADIPLAAVPVGSASAPTVSATSPAPPENSGEAGQQLAGAPLHLRTDTELGPQQAAPQAAPEPQEKPETPAAAPAPGKPAAHAHAPPSRTETHRAAQPHSAPSHGGWYVQVGAYSKRGSANTVLAELRKAGYHGDVTPITVRGVHLYRVRIGGYPDKTRAMHARDAVRRQGYPHAQAISP